MVKIKGPNPFAAWEESPGALAGRKDESRIFNGFLNAASSAQGGILIVYGGPGIGKSALLRLFRAEAEKAGMLSPSVAVENGETEGEVAGKIVREAGMLAGMEGTEQAPAHIADVPQKVQKMAKKAFGAVIFIDDMDRMKAPGEALRGIEGALKAAWGKRNAAFVLGMSQKPEFVSGIATFMELRPFGEQEARELTEKALKKGPPKMGDECLLAILSDSGGNPKLFRSVCRVIYERLRDNEKVITKGHYLGYLPFIMSMLGREWFGGMYNATPPGERAILHVLAGREEGMHVSDIAKSLDKPLGPVTALAGRLLARGQIVRLDRGKYRIFSKLYARYVVSRG
ncbi:MAG: AAA family ATPase [Candidatus Micrarchaeota archaeon]